MRGENQNLSSFTGNIRYRKVRLAFDYNQKFFLVTKKKQTKKTTNKSQTNYIVCYFLDLKTTNYNIQ